MIDTIKSISKILSANDTGETGSHQAGILVPKVSEILSYFPKVNREEKNPRAQLLFEDDSGEKWTFTFIYYNNKFFGGTRNEYRLTGMTSFLKAHGLKAGDTLILGEENNNGLRKIEYIRQQLENRAVLRLGGSWKIWNGTRRK